MKAFRLLLCLSIYGCGENAGAAIHDGPDAGDAGASDGGPSCPPLPDVPGIETVVSGLVLPTSLAIDDDHVFWIEGDRGVRDGCALFRAPKEGGPAELLVDGLDHPRGLSVTADAVWWNEVGVEDDLRGRIVTVPKSGGQPVVISDDLHFPWALVADDRAAFWTNTNDETKELELWTVDSDSSAGPARRLLSLLSTRALSVPNSKLYLDDEAIHWAISAATYGSLAEEGELGSPGVVRIPRAAMAEPELLVSSSGINADAAAIAGDDIYVLDRIEGLFRAAPNDAAEPLVEIAAPPSGSWLVDAVADSRSVYWHDPSSVHARSHRADSETVVVVAGEPRVVAFALDDASIYWTVWGADEPRACGAIRRTTKPQ